MRITNQCKVELLDVMGEDLTVVNAARVSFHKESGLEWFGTTYEDAEGDLGYVEGYFGLSEKDCRLIAHLATHGHWSPFSHPQLSFRISAPIFVARQLGKHQVGLAWNEVSRRYVDDEPVMFLPDYWRAKAPNVKQGSSDDTVALDPNSTSLWPLEAMEAAVDTYNSLLFQGVCPEQARMVLPQAMMTEWIWTGSLYAFARVCNLRIDPHAQLECRMVAEDIAQALQDNFPVSWDALRNKQPDV